MRTILVMLLSMIMLSGCGSRIVFTAGFAGNEVFEVGGEACSVQALRVYMLETMHQTEEVFGDNVWESADAATLKEAVREKSLSRISRVMALSQLAVTDNIMLTSDEEKLLEQAAQEYLDSRSEAERKYLDISASEVAGMYRDYVLAIREYESLGDNFETIFNSYGKSASNQLNQVMWETIETEDLSGESSLSTGFDAIYDKYFG